MATDFTITALNDATDSENRMHSDEVAARYGFVGALVSGVNVFGYMTQPLVAEFGTEWLSNTGFDVRFLLPAYEQDAVSVTSTQAEESMQANSRHRIETCASNQHDITLAKLASWPLGPIDSSRAQAMRVQAKQEAAIYEEAARPELSWDVIHLERAAPTWHWTPSKEDNDRHVEAQRDPAACYRGTDALIHPYFLLDTCNRALMRLYVLPAWIHVGTVGSMIRAIKVGEAITVDCRPIERWERKGHQFIRLYIAMFSQDDLVFEAEHTAIFSIAAKQLSK